MIPIIETYTPATANLTGFASNVTGGTWTLTANSSGDSLAHQISLRNDSLTNHSAKTVTFVGTDQDGFPLTETINMPGSSATVYTTNYFLTVTSATPSASIGTDTMDIGWRNTFVTKTLGLCWRGKIAAVNITVTGTINYTVQQTLSDIQTSTRTSINWLNSDDTNVVSATASKNTNYVAIPNATRLLVASYNAGAALTFAIRQQDIR